MNEHLTRSDECPACGAVFNRASNIRGEGAPGPGDITICIHCAAINQFDASLRLRPFAGEMDDETAKLVERARSLIFQRRQ